MRFSSDPVNPTESYRLNGGGWRRGGGGVFGVRMGVWVATAVWVTAMAVSVPAAAVPRCDLCGKSISGRYMVYEKDGAKTEVCSTCNGRYPHCGRCGVPFREPAVVVGGAPLCRSCAREAVVCSVCKGLIRGEYTVFTLEGQEWPVCSQCRVSAPRCAACNRPLGQGEAIQTGGRILCRQCDATLTRCEACGQSIVGTRYSIRFRPGEFCGRCWETRPVCSMCGVPCTDPYSQLSDGRILCTRCAASSVTTLEDIESMYKKIKPLLEKELGRPLNRSVKLRLVGPEEIDRMPPGFRVRDGGESHPVAGASAPPESTPDNVRRIGLDEGRGAGGRELGKFVRQGDKFEIRILSGQPKAWAWETLAHEFAHAWQSEHNSDLNDPVWEEGFAQWAAELALHEMGMDGDLEKLRLRDDFYGQAYRIVNHYETLRGKAGVIHAVLTMTNEPKP